MYALFRAYQNVNFAELISNALITFSILIMAVTLNGDWVIIMVHAMRQLGVLQVQLDDRTVDKTLAWLSMNDFRKFWTTTMLSGFGTYFIVGFFLHWYYYVRQKDHPELWKSQPKRWLSRELELDEIKVSIISLLVTNTWSAMMACYVYNGGKYSTIYYEWDEYGMLWWFLQFPFLFVYQDYTAYWLHRLFHIPYLYKRFHKVHHKYLQPTAFSVTAFHPVEISVLQIALILPIFTVPIHWVPLYAVTINSFYHGVTAHSGINFKSKWWQPWQTDAVYHDNHHQYVHVNYGFNCYYWDMIHNTYRKPDRVYNKDSGFSGCGVPVTEISPEELEKEIQERQTESSTAYEKNNNPFLHHLIKSKKT